MGLERFRLLYQSSCVRLLYTSNFPSLQRFKCLIMNTKLIEKISETLREIANSALPPQLEPSKYVDCFGDNILYSLPTESYLSLNDQVGNILKNSDFSSKFSSKYINDKLKSIFISLLQDTSFNVEKNLTELIRELEEFNEFSEVYLKIEGILLEEMCFELGKVKFLPGDDFLLSSLNGRVNSGYFGEDHFNELHDNRKGNCVAVVKVKAIPEKAYEVAKEEVGRAIDLIRYCSKILYPLSQDIRVGLKGDYPRTLRHGFIFSDSSIFSNREFLGSPKLFKINEKSLNKMQEIGIFSLSEALKKDYPTDFEKSLIRTIHWFSMALTQDETENAFLLLIIALECLFKVRSKSISFTIRNSTALLISKNSGEKEKNSKLMQKFYRHRGFVAHGTEIKISDLDLYKLMDIVIRCIQRAIQKIGNFK